MNDDNTNRPRDNTVTTGGDFKNMEYVADAVIYELSAEQMITYDELRNLINMAGRLYYKIGFDAGRAEALYNVVALQLTTKQQTNTPNNLNISSNQTQQRTADAMPLQLLTYEARQVWQALVEANFLDQDWKPRKETSNPQRMYIALLMSQRFLGGVTWQPFERLWNTSHLAQQHYKMTETGRKPERWKEIEKIVEKNPNNT